ncbi:MAG: hypothetical protein HYY24_07775 [Verrucomicrobia bacterium]|nr:hypothetical protein [Verrucomicrobiota bacterium]
MSVQELEKQIRALPPSEAARLGRWFDGYRETLALETPDDDWEDDLSEEHRAEILRRAELANNHPELLEPWEGTTARVRRRLHEIRAKKAAAH